MGRRKGDGPKNLHGSYKALPVGGLLARMANKLPPEKPPPAKKRGHERGTPYGKRTLTPDDVRAIRKEYPARDVTYKTLAAKYGVSAYTIERIVTWLCYQDVGTDNGIHRQLLHDCENAKTRVKLFLRPEISR